MLRIVLKVLLCLLLAGGSLFWALSSMEAVLAYSPVLDLTPPSPGMALGGNPDGRVILVLVDGLRLDTSLNAQIMPALASLRRQGASATMHSGTPSYSTPSYCVLMTGAWPEMSGGKAFNPEQYQDN